MSAYRYQEKFSDDLTAKWLAGQQTEVRITLRQLKKAQAAYLAAAICYRLACNTSIQAAAEFVAFIHPNNVR